MLLEDILNEVRPGIRGKVKKFVLAHGNEAFSPKEAQEMAMRMGLKSHASIPPSLHRLFRDGAIAKMHIGCRAFYGTPDAIHRLHLLKSKRKK